MGLEGERFTLGASCLGYAVGVLAMTVQPAIRVRLTLIEPAHIMLLYEARRGKRAHPIFRRVFAQGSLRARAAYQSQSRKRGVRAVLF
jgi:hypothetical protein